MTVGGVPAKGGIQRKSLIEPTNPLQGPKAHNRTANNTFALKKPPHMAIRAAVAIIAQHKVLIFWHGCRPPYIYRRGLNVLLGQWFTVDENFAIFDLNFFAR